MFLGSPYLLARNYTTTSKFKMKYVPPSDYTVIHGLYTPRACRIVFVIHRTVRILYGYGTVSVKPCVRAERQGLNAEKVAGYLVPFSVLPPS